MLFALWQPEKSTCVRRFELPTPWSVAKCSIQLSYTHILFILNEQVILYNSFWRMSTVFLIFLNFFYCWFISNYIDISTRNSSYFPTMKWGLQGSNLWPSACKADALPAELRPHTLWIPIWNSTKRLLQRPRWDSNPRPPPWQGGALTNWATRP